MSYNSNEWWERVSLRVDLTGHLTHLTKSSVINEISYSPLDVLIKILRERTIIGSTTDSGFIVGNSPAVCFFDAPIYSICENLHYEHNRNLKNSQNHKKYDSFGLMLPKTYVFKKGGRPVIYDKTEDAKQYLPPDKWWRIVNLNYDNSDEYIDWTHEREWRFPQNIKFDIEEAIVLVRNASSYKDFYKKGSVDGEDITKLVSFVMPIWQQYL